LSLDPLQVHSESQALPAPFGFETQLPEFENVTFPSHDEYFSDFHQHEKHEVVSHVRGGMAPCVLMPLE